ncbi:phage antirepressor KilAC domain-containing protein [Bacillus cereus]|uniref:phage antirepressor KilAC domain-containing protein n=1 Tax=Bacillus cereus TaxID=1396 RepID=UPI003C77BFCD|nr:phage antirepressor KilAC domain-containing protein [Bacillus cereus]
MRDIMQSEYKGEKLVLEFNEKALGVAKPIPTEVELIESKQKRNELAGRIDVLGKVKALLLLPSMEFATTRQIAEYYEVPVNTITKIYSRHRKELHEDGYKTMAGRELVENLAYDTKSGAKIEQKRGQIVVEAEGQRIQLSYTKIGLYPKRAILRIGMLLRDSEVAREVRTQLLNIEENAGESVKVAEVNRELELYTELAKAMVNGDVHAVTVLNAKILEYKNRHIAEVEAKLSEVTHERDALSEKVAHFVESDEVYTFSEVAEELDGLSAQALRNFLQMHGVLAMKSRGEVYRPIGRYKGLGWFSTKTKKAKWKNFEYTHTYITTKGRMEIAEMYEEIQLALTEVA